MNFMCIEIPKIELGIDQLSINHTCQTYSNDVEEIKTRIRERMGLKCSESLKGDDSEEHF